MPKVDERHEANRRQQILTAARQVCSEKPASAVTMRDVVRRSGMSQGGVYKYYSNMDEVLAELMNDIDRHTDLPARVRKRLARAGSPSRALHEALDLIADYICETAATDARIHLDLLSIYTTDPERYLRIRGMVAARSTLETVYDLISRHIDAHAGQRAGRSPRGSSGAHDAPGLRAKAPDGTAPILTGVKKLMRAAIEGAAFAALAHARVADLRLGTTGGDESTLDDIDDVRDTARALGRAVSLLVGWNDDPPPNREP